MAERNQASRMAVTVRPRASAADVVEIDVYDEIGIDFWTGEGVTAKAIRDALKGSKPKTIKLSVNSAGGDAFEGVAIYNVLRQYGDKGTHIVGDVTGLAASAASIVLAAADEVHIPSNAAIMVHEAWSSARGGAGDFRKRADLLEQINGTAADTYVRSAMRRGAAKTRDDMLALMAAETWMFGSEAVDAGFADDVTDALEAAASVDVSHSRRAAEMLSRLPIPAPRGATEIQTMNDEAIKAERDAAQAAKEAAALETRTAIDLATKAESERDAALAKLADLEAAKLLADTNAAEQTERAAKLAADLNRREVAALVGTRLYSAELEPMVTLRARDPELFASLLAARPPIDLATDITGADTPENRVTADPEAKLADLVRAAGKDH